MTERFYGELATWWPLISPKEEYAEEAAEIARLLGSARDVLELGSGGGSNAYHLKARFTLTLVDLSADMLAISRALNPECEHLQGDMRTLRLNRAFDAVLVHDAIDYMTTENDLRAAFDTAFSHCRPGGVALFIPDEVAETFEPGADHGGTGDVRYLEWSWDPDPGDTLDADRVRLPAARGRPGAERARNPPPRPVRSRDVASSCWPKPASTLARSSRRRPRTAHRA